MTSGRSPWPWVVIALIALVASPVVVGAVRYFDEESMSEMSTGAQATVGDFVSAVKKGDFETACSLLGRPNVDGSSGPRQDPSWPAACRERYLPRTARGLRNAEVGEVVSLQGFNAWWDYFPLNRVISATDDQDVDTVAVAVTGAPLLGPRLSPGRSPTFGLSNYEGLDAAGGCDREWCITSTPLGPVGKP